MRKNSCKSAICSKAKSSSLFIFCALNREARPSTLIRIAYISSMSFSEIQITIAPLLGMFLTSPSNSNCIIASRTGVLLTFNS